MKVALVGGTGFVGSYLVDELLRQGHDPVLLVRPGSEHRVRHAERCGLVSGDLDDHDAVRETVRGCDATVYNVGILREDTARGVSFEALHFEAARRVMDYAEEAGVQRFALMSANGARVDGGRYQSTKYKAEQYLRASAMDWTIHRPSVLFGNPRGRMEFATQLYRDIVSRPIPAPWFFDGLLPLRAGAMELSPVHVENVAQIMVAALERDDCRGRILSLGGPQRLSWRRILEVIGDATGHRVLGVPTPAWAVKAVATVLGDSDIMPVTREQISMLMEGNSCDSSGLFQSFGISPVPFDAAHLRYLKADGLSTAARTESPA